MTTTPTLVPETASPQPGRKGRLHGATVATLRRMIITGELPAGQKLREQEICEQLGVSRTPLREALRTLAAQGLVRLTQNRGAEVASLTLDDILGLYEVVSTLEALAARLACKTISDEAVAEIGMLHYRMMRHQARAEQLEYFALNQQIHRALVEASRNAALLEAWEGLSARIERAKYLPNLQPTRWKAAMQEHDAMLAALVARDGEGLARLIEIHFANSLAAILAAANPGVEHTAETPMPQGDDEHETP